MLQSSLRMMIVRINQLQVNFAFMSFCFAAISVQLESPSYSVIEGESARLCAVLDSGVLERDVDLSVVGLSGSAQEDDYMMDVLTFSLGSTQNQSCILVEILKDNLVEGEEIFQVILSSQDPAVVISMPNSATINIEDDNGSFIN